MHLSSGMLFTTSFRTLYAALSAFSLPLLLAAPGVAQSATLLDRPLSVDLGNAQLALSEVDLGLDGDATYSSIVWLDPPAVVTDQDRRRVHRGAILTALGIPLAASSVGAFVAAGASSTRDGCRDGRRPTGAFAGAGLALMAVGATFSSAGVTALRKASPEARFQKSPKTRALVVLSAAFGAILGLGTITAAGFGSSFCST